MVRALYQPIQARMSTSPKSPARLDLTIARTIRTLREGRGLSQATLGDAIGVTFQQVQKYEKGANRISSSRLQRIAEALKVPISTFFVAADERAPEPLSEQALAVAMRFERLSLRDRRAVEALIEAMSDGDRAQE